MAELGALLETLHREPRYGRVRAIVEHWRDEPASHAASVRAAERSGGKLYAVAEGPPSPPRRTWVTRLWHERPDRWRAEVDGEDPMAPSLAVSVGDLWWRWDARHGALTNEQEPAAGFGGDDEVRALFDPWQVAGLLRFETGAEMTVAGRRGLTCRARPRTVDRDRTHAQFALHCLGYGADEYLLTVDAEQPLLLRVEARSEGRPFSVLQVSEIAFDEPFTEDVFVFDAPDGKPARSPRDLFRVEHGPLHELAAKAPFTVWAPIAVDDDWHFHGTFSPGGEDGPPSVSLFYSARVAGYGITISQSPREQPVPGYDPDDDRWRDVRRDGSEVAVIDMREGPHPLVVVRLDRGDTHVQIQGQGLDPERLVELALALEPAPTEPPPLQRRG